MSDTTTPTKNESLPELVARWRADAKAHEIKSDRPDQSLEVTEWHAGYDEATTRCADELEAALTREAPTEGVGEYCEKCGGQAVHYLVMDNIPNARRMPFCDRCTHEHEQTAQEVNDHEMRNFGGAYGLVAFHYEPLTTTPPAPQRLAQGEDEFSLSAEELAVWLDRKYARHGEDEDRQAAAMLRKLSTQPPNHDRGEDLQQRARELLADELWRSGNELRSLSIRSGDGTVHLIDSRDALAALIAALTEAKQQGPWEAVRYEFRRKNRYNGEWSEWVQVDATTEAEVRAEPDTVQDEWQFRTLYTAPQVEAKRQTGEGRGILDLYEDSRPDKILFELALHVGADLDGGEVGDQHGQSSPATMTFTDEQLVAFSEKLLDGSYQYKGFER